MPEGVVQEAPVHCLTKLWVSHGASCSCSKWAEGKGQQGPAVNRQQSNPNIELPKGAMQLELDGGQVIAMALRCH